MSKPSLTEEVPDSEAAGAAAAAAAGKGPHWLQLSTFTPNSGVVNMASWGLDYERELVSTPLSPSSVFTFEVVSDISHSFLDSIMLCCWDNILGPRLQHVWYVKHRPQHHRHLLLQAARQALSGEITRNPETSVVDFKLFDQPDQGLVVPTFVFSTAVTTSFTVQAVVLLVPVSERDLYLRLDPLVQAWIRRIVAKLRVLLCNRGQIDKCLPELRVWFTDFLQMLSSLDSREAGLPLQIKLDDTAFCPKHNMEPKFLCSAITSHLVTFRRSVVIGKLPERINLMIATLALFNTPEDRTCSRYVREDQSWGYHHDLCIQGILKGPEEKVGLPVGELLRSQLPTSIVDIQLRMVSQSPNVLGHVLGPAHLRALKEELVCLHYSMEEMPQESVEEERYPESLVHNLMEELEKLPAECGVREAYIAQFLRLLNRRAVSLIKYLEFEMDRDRNAARAGLKRLRQDLGLTLEGDFLIVLATAERLQPGVYAFLRGSS